jgi:hypothetical protein
MVLVSFGLGWLIAGRFLRPLRTIHRDRPERLINSLKWPQSGCSEGKAPRDHPALADGLDRLPAEGDCPPDGVGAVARLA